MKGFFATVEIYRRPVWNIYSYFCQNFIRIPFFVFHNGGYGVRMSWVEKILKINKRGGGGCLGWKIFLKLISGEDVYYRPESMDGFSNFVNFLEPQHRLGHLEVLKTAVDFCR